MKVLLTGGAGFIGSHVVDRLIDAGHQVVILDDLSTGSEENVNPKAKFYKMDICDPKLDELFCNELPEIVNHHAAQMSVRRSIEEPLFDAQVNIIGSLNLIECSIKHAVKKFIYISTGGAVYGEPQYLPCDEQHPVNPLSQYGVTKHTIEHYLYLYHVNYGLGYIVLRYPNVYGPRQDPYGEAGVIAIFARQMLSRDDTVIYGDGEQERDFVYVDDIVAANLLVTMGYEPELAPTTCQEDTSSQQFIYNLGTGRGTSINHIFQLLKHITGYHREPLYGPARSGEVYKICLDAHKIEQTLGWTANTTLAEGLNKTVDWFKAN